MSASLYADALAPFLEEAEHDCDPLEAEVFDAHTHLGLDEDGRSLDLATLLAQLDAARARARACVFPLHDPERMPSYSVPNDRVLAWASESEGRLIPFCRLDPAEAPVAEGERCIAKRAHAESSCTHAHRRSPSTARRWMRSSRWPKKRACRS